MESESVTKIKFNRTTRFGNVVYHKGAQLLAPFTDDIKAEIAYNIALLEDGRQFDSTVDILETVIVAEKENEAANQEQPPWSYLPKEFHKGRKAFKDYIAEHPEEFLAADVKKKAIEKFEKFYPEDEIPLILRTDEEAYDSE